MFWTLVFSYWFHLLATLLWLGGLGLALIVVWPALRQGVMAGTNWKAIQRRFMPLSNLSLTILLLTGFFQMTNDVNYSGFLAIDNLWAWAMLIKHLAYAAIIGTAVYLQAFLYPAMTRLEILQTAQPNAAQADQQQLEQRETGLLRLNLLCALVVLFFTAVATAV